MPGLSRKTAAKPVVAAANPAIRAERFYGQCLVVLHIEASVDLCYLQNVVDLLGQVQQFEFAALFLGSGKGMTSSPIPSCRYSSRIMPLCLLYQVLIPRSIGG
jgi:hypothetical protein